MQWWVFLCIITSIYSFRCKPTALIIYMQLRYTLGFCLFFSATQAIAHGAIAVGDENAQATDDSTQLYFITSGHPNSDAATLKVLNECEAKGLKFCHVASWFDRCGAYARTATKSGTGSGRTAKLATAAAIASCNADGCKVIAAQCDAADDI